MRRLTLLIVTLLCVSIAPGAPASEIGSRVIVSNTLNGTLQIFDAATLEETQLPVLSKGSSPVRLAVQTIEGRTFLFSANHGIAGSLGIFDLSGDEVTELRRSPFPTGRFGSVGVATGKTSDGKPYVAVTNANQALAGCDVPDGSVTVFDAQRLAEGGTVTMGESTELRGAQPFAVETNGEGEVYVSTNCADMLEVFQVRDYFHLTMTLSAVEQPTWGMTGRGPDGIAYDADRQDVYVANIGSSTLDVFETWSFGGTSPHTTVPVGAGPVEVITARSSSGRTWLIAADGRGDSITIVDRDAVAGCVAANVAICDASAVNVATGVAGGAPESVAYDAATNRVFVVNKSFPPSLSVIQLTEAGGNVSGTPIAAIPLGALGRASDIPSFIAFDVVVQAR